MNTSDKELLELAAKAAGYVIVGEVDAMVVQPGETKAGGYVIRNDRGGDSLWNPLLDDGDALRLAVKLKLNIQLEYSPTYHYADNEQYDALDGMNGCCTKGGDCNDDPYAATRRAIVRAAAEVGRGL